MAHTTDGNLVTSSNSASVMLAVRRYILRRHCLLLAALGVFVYLVIYFLQINVFSLPKWPGITSQATNDAQELVLLVKHLENEIESHTSEFNHSNNGVPQGSCKRRVKLIVVVQSKTSNFDRRNIIRSTWGDGCPRCRSSGWNVLFLTGKTNDLRESVALKEEQEYHHDLIPVDTIDNMRNITNKLIKGFRWVSRHCKYKYLVKSNDNVFLNVASLYDYLNQPSTPRKELYAGSVNWWSEVLRSGVYGVDPKEYKRNFYPRYCSGAAYVLSRDSVNRFVESFHQVPYLFIEDAFIGEMALKNGIDTIDNKMFRYSQTGCQFNNSFISYHPVDSADCMTEMYQKSLPSIARFYQD